MSKQTMAHYGQSFKRAPDLEVLRDAIAALEAQPEGAPAREQLPRLRAEYAAFLDGGTS